MKKCVLFIVLAVAVTVSRGQQVGNSGSNRTLQGTATKGNIIGWEGSTASRIPLESQLPVYDSMVSFSEVYDRNEVDANAQHYFTKVFNSRDVKLRKNKHQYEGTGMYIFCADRNSGPTGMYQVNFSLEVSITNNNLKINISDFKIKNQNTTVSLSYLIARAKENDANALKVLHYFHNNNLLQINSLLQTVAPKVANAANAMATK